MFVEHDSLGQFSMPSVFGHYVVVLYFSSVLVLTTVGS